MSGARSIRKYSGLLPGEIDYVEQRVQTYDLYLAAWSAISDADRERMLRVTSLTTSSSPIRSRPRAESPKSSSILKASRCGARVARSG